MGGRAVEGTGLENRQGVTPLVGSNPTPSAKRSRIVPILAPNAEPQIHLQSGIVVRLSPAAAALLSTAAPPRRKRLAPINGSNRPELAATVAGIMLAHGLLTWQQHVATERFR
jgi:hypothetical protein